jgi:hypothetical protein
VGQTVSYRSACAACPLDTVTTGVKVALLDLSQPGAPAIVPGTDLASGVSPGASADEIFYTLGGDARVFRRVLSSGEVSVAHDFGAAGIAREVRVAGRRLVAVVGGHVTFEVDSLLGPTQWDSGGVIHVVDLDTGADQELETALFFRRPALSPAGDRVVAEGYSPIIRFVPDPEGEHPDTTVETTGDLFLLRAP